MKFKTLLPILFLAATAVAQMPSKPAADLKKLDYFLGTWNVEGSIPPGPWGAGGKFNAIHTAEWMSGNSFIVTHSDFKMPGDLGGEGQRTSFTGFDPDQNVYTFNAFDSNGHRETSQGTLSADTWTWSSTENYGGQPIQQRMTIKPVSPTSYNFKIEVSVDGTNWMTFMDAKATRK